MTITRFSTGAIRDNALATNVSFAASDMELIGTIRLNSSTASVTFSGIPQEYKHLQFRIIGRDTSSGSAWTQTTLRANGNSSAIYAGHYLYGDGSATGSSAATSVTTTRWSGVNTQSLVTANVFGVTILDVLDYSSAAKNKTFRSLAGYDANGSGIVFLGSGLFANTGAITSIEFLCGVSFAQNSKFALYGIRG